MDRQQLLYIKQQFHLLLDRANKRFTKLRELQTRGDSLPWSAAQASYNKTFDAFSRLWQYQRDNRAALLEAGLQRSELGGIANKVGQLYYNYYLRSGETGALLESYTFYDAVHTRQYFACSAVDAPDPAAAARQLRFYARFVVVCLFLNRKEEAMQLLQELQACVSSYLLQFAPPDAAEWQRVVNEVTSVLAADVAMPLPRCPGTVESPFKPPRRCRLTDPAATCAPHHPRIREAILVSYRYRQIRVAELPLELYRMAQALEWQDSRLGLGPAAGAAATEPFDTQQPAGCGSATSDAAGGAGAPGSRTVPVAAAAAPTTGSSSGSAKGAPNPSPGHGRQRNPPRQLLYKPTVQQVLGALLSVTVATAEKDVILLYIAADAAAAAAAEPPPALPHAAATQPAEPRQLLLSPCSHHHRHSQQQQQQALPAGVNPLQGPHSQGPHVAGQTQSAAGSGGNGAGEAVATATGTVHTTVTPRQQQPQQQQPLGQGAGPGAPPPGGGGSAGRGTQADAEYVDGLLAVDELLVATRRRLLLVVDSNMSRDFSALQGREKGPQLLCLQSAPQPPPGPLTDPSRHGSLFTMALACPAQALCALCGEADPAPAVLQRLQDILDDVMLRLGRALSAQFASLAELDRTAAGTTAAGTAGGTPMPRGVTIAKVEPQSVEAAAADGGASGAATDGDGASLRSGTVGGAGEVAAGPTGEGQSRGDGQALAAAAAAAAIAWSPVFDDALARRLLLHFAFFRCCMSMYKAGPAALPAAAAAGSGAVSTGAGGAGSAAVCTNGGFVSGDSNVPTSLLVPSCFPALPSAAAATDEVLRQGVRRAVEALGRSELFEAA